MRLIRFKEVEHIAGLSRSSIYEFMKKGNFPKSFSIGERAIAWREDEIEEWVQDKIECRNDKSAIEHKVNTLKITEDDVIAFINNKFKQFTLTDAVTWIMQIIK